MKRLSRIIGAAALVVMATAGPAMAKGHQADRMVPIKGTVMGVHGVDMFATDCDIPPEVETEMWWRFTSEGTGRMSHLGRVEYVFTQCTYMGEFGPVSGGTTTFTAANGDVLVIAQSMLAEVYGEWDPDPDAFIGGGDWYVDETVLGGTGRFANATGLGVLHTYGDIHDGVPFFDDLADGMARFDFDGMIRYRASDRSGK